MIKPVRTAAAFVFALIAWPVSAADYPAPKEGAWVARAFRFHTGDVIPELRLHYTTVGDPTGTPVLIRASISSSCQMRLELENLQSRPMVCGANSQSTIMTTWWKDNTGS